MAYKLVVICGHGAGDPGACSDGFEERNLVRDLGKRIKELGGDAVYLYDIDKNCYVDTKNGKGVYTLPSIANGAPIVELHMDAFNTQAKGGHIIINANKNVTVEQSKLRDYIVAMFPGRSTTIKKRSDLLNCNVAARLNLTYCLCENGFIDNDGDRTKFVNNVDTLARNYLDAFGVDIADNGNNSDDNDIAAKDVWMLHDCGGGYVKLENSLFRGVYLMCEANGETK